MGVDYFHNPRNPAHSIHGRHIRSQSSLICRFNPHGLRCGKRLLTVTAGTGERGEIAPISGYPVSLRIVDGLLLRHGFRQLQRSPFACPATARLSPPLAPCSIGGFGTPSRPGTEPRIAQILFRQGAERYRSAASLIRNSAPASGTMEVRSIRFARLLASVSGKASTRWGINAKGAAHQRVST